VTGFDVVHPMSGTGDAVIVTSTVPVLI